ncbi:MAG: TadE/TadG family type IV pilus assembly protein [Phycisphaerae bacterium]
MAPILKPRRRPGAAILEFALIAPLLLLLTFALIEYGWLFLKAEETNSAARHGARLAILPDATNAHVLASIAGIMDTAGMGDSGYSVTFSPGDVSTVPPGETVTVEVSVLYGNVAIMGLAMVPVPGTLRASVSMAKEGP